TITGPGVSPATRTDPVSLVDVAPTILHAAGVAAPADMKGKDLLARTDVVALKPIVERSDPTSGTTGGGPEIYAETDYPRVAGWSPLHALTDGRWKTIRGRSSTEVYDLARDPAEEHDLAAAQPGTGRSMAARIDAIRSSGGPQR